MAGSGTLQLRDREDIVLRVEHLLVHFPAAAGRAVQAVSDVSFDIARGETLGLVGESGCGKSTVGRAIMQLPPPTGGRVSFLGKDLGAMNSEELRRTRLQLQMIFQDPISSLNPRRKVHEIIGEGLAIWGKSGAREQQHIEELMTAVGLDPHTAGDRRPHQFSGGQCQRICIARSLAMDPAMLICDEPVSALDVSVQAQILNLLEDMKARYQLTMLFIAHDLAVVKNVSDRVAVMYLGKLCELSDAESLYTRPAHPYTRALLASIPDPDPDLACRTGHSWQAAADTDAAAALQSEIPSPADPPAGCRFRTRCPRAQQRCSAEEPLMQRIGSDHFVACHYPHSNEFSSKGFAAA